jgi:hypothetical protein
MIDWQTFFFFVFGLDSVIGCEYVVPLINPTQLWMIMSHVKGCFEYVLKTLVYFL